MATTCVSAVVNKMKPILVILGATGTGKSKLAIQLAKTFDGEIISADSMQVYKGLDIVTNKVTMDEQAQCPHHMIDFVSPLHINYKVTDFKNQSLSLIEDIHCRRKLPVVVGGTNYYIESLLWDFLLDTALDEVDIVTKNPNTSPTSACNNCQLAELSTLELLHRLRQVDAASADRIHPKDRRKILRALQVFEQTGETRTKHLERQHLDAGLATLSGPLRFPDTCILWLQCDQDVLDSRLDARVDEMVRCGLVDELLDFHQQYNEYQLRDNKHCDYTLGIFQSIGFKEFHEYLLLSNDEKRSERGQQLFRDGVETMKRATRKYARRQLKWINNRFLKRKGCSSVPSIYALNATKVSNWQSNVTQIANEIVATFLQNRPPPIQPLLCEVGSDDHIYRECTVCGIVAVTKTNWEAHIKGHRHKKTVEYQRRLERLRQQLNDGQESQDSLTPLGSHDSVNDLRDSVNDSCSSNIISHTDSVQSKTEIASINDSLILRSSTNDILPTP